MTYDFCSIFQPTRTTLILNKGYAYLLTFY
jgi:hypothetical protein